MKVHEDDSRPLTEFFDFGQGPMKRIFQWRHERPALKIENPDGRKSLPFEYKAALARGSGRVIGWTHKPLFILQQLQHFFLVPKMVAARHHIHAGAENLLGG